MRILLLSSAFLISFIGSTQQSFDFFNTTESFLQKYCFHGKVDYQSIKSDSTLSTLIEHIGSDAIPAGDEKAYLINAYNLFVINQVAQNYPVDSPMDDPSFFTKKYMTLHGKKMSLNYLENEILRKDYADPRLHFVLVCGAIGCPPIENFAYKTSMLEEQLNAQARKALNNPVFVYQKEEDKSIYLSEIFNWYTSDFGKNNADVINYINTFRNEPFDDSYRIKFYPYNWTLNGKGTLVNATASVEGDPAVTSVNLQQFTAGSLLAKGKMDFTLFNTMYTETSQHWLGDRFSGYRTTFVTNLLQWTIGATKNKRINLGVDLNFRYSGTSSDSTFSGLKAPFEFKNTDSTRVGLTSAGIRVKVQPFKNVSDFSIQSTFMIPTIESPEGKPAENGVDGLFWADWNRYTWWNQFFYTKSFGDFQLFTEADILFRFRSNKSQIGMLDIPVSAFLSYFPTKKITVYAMTQHVHRFTNNITPNDPIITDWVIPSNYTASGLGFKYQLMGNLSAEFLYTNFWRARNGGLGSTFNLGIKFLTK